MSTTVSVCFSLLLSLIVGSQAAVIERGDCPKVTVVNPFDISAYLGDWYELQKFPAPLIEPNLKCVKAQYTLRDGHTVRVNNTGFDKKTGAYSEALGNATAEDPTIGSLRVTFSPMVPKDPNYLVLATDYKTYSLVYACTNYGSFNVQFAWILTRTPTLDATKTAQLRSTLNDFGIHSEKLTVTDQSCWQ